jgi:hypothetical protein
MVSSGDSFSDEEISCFKEDETNHCLAVEG